MSSIKGREIHSKAESAREEGRFIEALKFCDEAMEFYQQDEDALGFAEVQASRFLTLRHLFEQTTDNQYLTLAKFAALASVELAEKSEDPTAIAIPCFNLAKATETLEQYPEAVLNYQKALDYMTSHPPKEHGGARPAILADMKVHLLVCKYKAGDKNVLLDLDQAVIELEQATEEKYNKDVWLSGAHMKIAEILRQDNTDLAKEHLQKAKAIIDANPDLKLRAEQWQKLSKTFS